MLRTRCTYWTRQILFQSDPVQYHPARVFEYALITEFDTRHTADTIAAQLDTQSLSDVSDSRIDSSTIRILSLEGSAAYHNITPRDPADLTVDKITPGEVISGDKPSGPPYFGVPRHRYVHH